MDQSCSSTPHQSCNRSRDGTGAQCLVGRCDAERFFDQALAEARAAGEQRRPRRPRVWSTRTRTEGDMPELAFGSDRPDTDVGQRLNVSNDDNSGSGSGQGPGSGSI